MARRGLPLVAVPVPPFLISDHGDLHVVDSLEHPGVETYDALEFEYFDAEGRRLRPIVEEPIVYLELDPDSDPEPERLLELIHAYVHGVIQRGVQDSDRVLLEETLTAPTLRESAIALKRFLDAKESRSLLGWLSRPRLGKRLSRGDERS
jgi:hypothetical protein